MSISKKILNYIDAVKNYYGITEQEARKIYNQYIVNF